MGGMGSCTLLREVGGGEKGRVNLSRVVST